MVGRGLPLALFLLVATPTLAAETIRGAITARVVSVYDGDTLTVDATPWPGVTIRTSVPHVQPRPGGGPP